MNTREDWLALDWQGWQQLIMELDARLRERWPDYTIQQVKEKFGTLRFYAAPGLTPPDFPDDEAGTAADKAWFAANVKEFFTIIDEYEEKSSHVCERCGQPGSLGDRDGWWATRCTDCAPTGWVSADVECDHESITDDVCDSCGRTRIARLEHSDVVLMRVHPRDACAGEYCTVHRRSDHTMRGFPQQWRSDRLLMERICPHGVGHPDPDDIALTGPHGAEEAVHGCDGCCAPAG